METGSERQDEGSTTREVRLRCQGWTSSARHWRSARKTRWSRGVPLALGAVTALVLAVALLIGPRDTSYVQHADAAPIGTTRFAQTSTTSASAPENDDFNREAYFQTPFTLPGNSVSVSFPESTAGATLEAGETAACGAIGATVWFGFTSDRAATVAIDT